MFLKQFLILLLTLVVNVSSTNVLLVISDDLNNIFKEQKILNKMPAMKLLMDDPNTSIFTNTYTQFSVCGPSRASLLTGLSPLTTFNFNFIEKVDQYNTLPKFLTNL